MKTRKAPPYGVTHARDRYQGGPAAQRRLRLEQLEDRNAPGALLLPGMLGLGEFLLDQEQVVMSEEVTESRSTTTADSRITDLPLSKSVNSSIVSRDIEPTEINRSTNQSVDYDFGLPGTKPDPWHDLAMDQYQQLGQQLDIELLSFLFTEEDAASSGQTDGLLNKSVPQQASTSAGSGVATASATGSASQGGPSGKCPNVCPSSTPAFPGQLPAVSHPDASSALVLIDADGESLNITPDQNTLIIGAATWCGACAHFKANLAAPGAAEELAGLNIVFAFGDEGGSGPGGVLQAEFLADLPGEVAFLGEGSPRPDRFPSAFNAVTGQFDFNPYHTIDDWLASSQVAATIEPASDGPQALHLPPANGDFDGDEDVDDTDYMTWEANFGTTSGADKTDGDADGDFDVDGFDFLAWQRTFGAVNPVGEFSILTGFEVTLDDTPFISWTTASGAVSYDLTVTSDPAGTNVVQQYLGGTGTSVTLTPLPSSGDYYLFVTAEDAEGHHRTADNNGGTLTIPPSFHRVFVTSSVSNISSDTSVPPASSNSWGGLAAADWVCSFHAETAGLPGMEGWDFVTPVYTAILSDSTANAVDRLSITGPVFGIDDGFVALDKSSLFDGEIDDPIVFDEFGETVGGDAQVWSGTDINGVWTGKSCGDWDDPSGSVEANMGLSGETGSGWIDGINSLCDEPARLYCVSPVINQ